MHSGAYVNILTNPDSIEIVLEEYFRLVRMKHIAIIGNGISGITAARHIRKLSKHRITVISSETKYFFSRTTLMYIYMGHMKYEHTKPYEDWFWDKNNIDLKFDHVKGIDFENKKLMFNRNETLDYDDLIIATGSKPNKFGWPGQELKGVQGLYSFQDLENMEQSTKNISRAVVVGGGLIGIEMVEMLLSRNIPTTFLVREKSFWDVVLPEQESQLITRHIKEHHVDLRLNTELKEIKSTKNGVVSSIVTNNGEEIECDFVGIAVGVHPNIELVQNTSLETNKGILVDEYLESNIPGVYAIGDCAEQRNPMNGRKAIEQVWYTGRIMGETVAHSICSKKTKYNPGHWFNSAKFFDIEYQTYGIVNPQLAESDEEFYWEDNTGRKCIHIIFHKNTGIFKGINSLGIRLRHEVCDNWLKNEKTIDHVISNLHLANFDPEFYDKYENDIAKSFTQAFPSFAVKTKTKSSIFAKMLSI